MRVYNSVLPFIIWEGMKIKNIIIVRLKTLRPVYVEESPPNCLIEAVTQWVERTKYGKECWEYSCGDLNIGDLSSYEKHFRKWLRRQTKLKLVDMEFIYGGPVNGLPNHYFLLVTEEKLRSSIEG